MDQLLLSVRGKLTCLHNYSGYNSQPGVSYVGNNGQFFPNTFAPGTYATFTNGDVIKIEYFEDNTISFYKNNVLIVTGKNPNPELSIGQLYPTGILQ